MQQSIDLVDCKACAYANVDARAWYSSISLRLGAGAAVERRGASPLLRQVGIRHDHAAAAADAARRAPAAADAVAGRAASQGPAAPPQPRRRRVLRRRCRSHRPRECPSDVATALQTGPDLTGRRTRLAAFVQAARLRSHTERARRCRLRAERRWLQHGPADDKRRRRGVD